MYLVAVTGQKDFAERTNQPPKLPKVAGVFTSRTETTATTFSYP